MENNSTDMMARAQADSTDMMAEARNAQWSALTFLGEGSVRAVAPAKVNLFLGVGGRLDSGYHAVTTVMHALALHDTLFINCTDVEGGEGDVGGEAAKGGEGGEGASSAHADAAKAAHMAVAGPAENLRVSITVADKTAGLGRAIATPLHIPVESNLAFKAIDALAHKAGFTEQRTVKVHIEKQIPSQAGLGGGSADAAAALAAMAYFWGISADDKLLSEAAAEVGSDVAFFLRGGCGLYDGTGERFQHPLVPSSKPLVLAKPPLGVSTKKAYAAFDENPTPLPANLAEEAFSAQTADQVPLFNNLAPAAFSIAPELASVQDWLKSELAAAQGKHACGNAESGSCGSQGVPLLAGSGSAMFAIVDSFAQAARLAGAAQARGWWSRATTLSKLGARVVEA